MTDSLGFTHIQQGSPGNVAKYSPDQKRHPKGDEKGGEFAPDGGGESGGKKTDAEGKLTEQTQGAKDAITRGHGNPSAKTVADSTAMSWKNGTEAYNRLSSMVLEGKKDQITPRMINHAIKMLRADKKKAIDGVAERSMQHGAMDYGTMERTARRSYDKKMKELRGLL